MKAITGATLIDGSGGPPILDAIVLIEGDRIEAAGLSDSVIVLQNSETIDASGMTLLPGLIDCHDHLRRSATRSPAGGALLNRAV